MRREKAQQLAGGQSWPRPDRGPRHAAKPERAECTDAPPSSMGRTESPVTSATAAGPDT